VLVHQGGYKRTSHKFLEKLESSLREAGIGIYPDLTDPANEKNTYIHFYDLNNPIPGLQHPRQLFAEERELERFLWMNRAVLPYIRNNFLKITGRQVRIASDCIIDLLAEDKKTHELVGFELKAAQAHDRLIGQAAKYMQALAKHAATEHRPGARLMIVTGQPDPRLAERVQVHAQEHGVPTQWLLYHVSVGLSEAK
jgi:hypothetical protein